MRYYAVKQKNDIPYLHCIKDDLIDRYALSPKEVYDLAANELAMPEYHEEYLYLLALNTKGRIIGVFEIAHGSMDACLFDLSQIVLRAILSGSKKVIIVHNHPSGDTTPSEVDIISAKQLYFLCEELGIIFDDSIIVCEKRFESLRESGVFTVS